jgi:hypothetical protein
MDRGAALPYIHSLWNTSRMRQLYVFAVMLPMCHTPAATPAGPSETDTSAAAKVAPAAETPELSHLSWSTVADAPGALVELRQIATAKGRCSLTATVGGATRWAADVCIASRTQLRFLSPDGDSLVVLEPLPDFASPLGAIYRRGRRLTELTPASLHLRPGAMRVEAGKVHWLGERDQRVSAAGVEVQLADGSTLLIGLDAAAEPLPAAAVASPGSPEPARCSPCSYTDDSGTYHLVENLEQIPEQFRKRADRVRGSIQHADAAPRPAKTTPERTPWKSSLKIAAPVYPRDPNPDRGSQGQAPGEYNNGTKRWAPIGFDPNRPCVDNSGAQVRCDSLGITQSGNTISFGASR